VIDADGRTYHHVSIAKVSAAKWSARYGDRELGVWRDLSNTHALAGCSIWYGTAWRHDANLPRLDTGKSGRHRMACRPH
jgi:hypothetical protein